MAAKFVLKKGSSGKFRFNLLATNGQVIATSEAYESKRAALAGINSIKKNAEGAQVEDQTSGGSDRAAKAAKSSKPDKETKARKEAKPRKESADSKSSQESKARKEAKKSTGKKSSRSSKSESSSGVEMNLGMCRYGEEGEEATVMAVQTDGTGWIAVCEDHVKEAEKDGFKVDKSKAGR